MNSKSIHKLQKLNNDGDSILGLANSLKNIEEMRLKDIIKLYKTFNYSFSFPLQLNNEKFIFTLCKKEEIQKVFNDSTAHGAGVNEAYYDSLAREAEADEAHYDSLAREAEVNEAHYDSLAREAEIDQANYDSLKTRKDEVTNNRSHFKHKYYLELKDFINDLQGIEDDK